MRRSKKSKVCFVEEKTLQFSSNGVSSFIGNPIITAPAAAFTRTTYSTMYYTFQQLSVRPNSRYSGPAPLFCSRCRLRELKIKPLCIVLSSSMIFCIPHSPHRALQCSNKNSLFNFQPEHPPRLAPFLTTPHANPTQTTLVSFMVGRGTQ